MSDADHDSEQSDVDVEQCPECGSTNTGKQYDSTVGEGYKENYRCGNCSAKFTAYYTFDHKKVDQTGKGVSDAK